MPLYSRKNEKVVLLVVADHHQGPHCVGIQGKWPQNFPVRENTGNFEILPNHIKKNTIFCLYLLANYLILKTFWIWKMKVMEHEKMAKSDGIL